MKAKNTFLVVTLLTFISIASAQTTPPEGAKLIVLTTTENASLQLAIRAENSETPAWIETSPNNYTKLIIGTGWSGNNYSVSGTKLNIYGDITGIDCNENNANLTALDVTKNPVLTYLSCYDNQLTALDLTKNPALAHLDCSWNQIETLDLSKNEALTKIECHQNKLTNINLGKKHELKYLKTSSNELISLDLNESTVLEAFYAGKNKLTALDFTNTPSLLLIECSENQLTSLNVTNNRALKKLYCDSNQLETLDLSQNIVLEDLYCSSNLLTSLDVTKNANLRVLSCYNNNFTTLEIDKIYCGLPQRVAGDNAKIVVIEDNTSSDYSTVIATNKTNATDKNWKVQYLNNSDIPDTTGNYECGMSIDEEEIDELISIYPNPTTDNVQIIVNTSLGVNEIRIVSTEGKLVKRIGLSQGQSNYQFNVSNLPKGIYIVQVGGKSQKLIIK